MDETQGHGNQSEHIEDPLDYPCEECGADPQEECRTYCTGTAGAQLLPTTTTPNEGEATTCAACGRPAAVVIGRSCLDCDPLTAGTCRSDNLLCSGDYPHRDHARARFLVDHTTGLIIDGRTP